jgi:hypothetical protein
MTKLCYITLPKREFQNLQKRVFPAYFRLQVGLTALTIVTFPKRSFLSMPRRPLDLIPLVLVFAMGLLNWLVYGPGTSKVMQARAELGKQSRIGKYLRCQSTS